MRKKNAQMPKVIVFLVLALIVFVVLVFLFVNGFFSGDIHLNPFITTQNAEVVSNSCRLACVDSDHEAYCVNETRLVLEGDVVVEGTCHAMSKVGFSGFEGIRPCFSLECEETQAECFVDNRKVDCDSLS